MPTIKGRVVLHHVADTSVRKDREQELATEELSGLFFDSKDNRALYQAAAQVLIKGNGDIWIQGFEIYQFDDDSTISTRVVSSGTASEDGTYQATIEVLFGTGRFESTFGTGKLTGWSNGYNAYHDVELALSGFQ